MGRTNQRETTLPFRLAANEASATRVILGALVVAGVLVAAGRYVATGHRSQPDDIAPAASTIAAGPLPTMAGPAAVPSIAAAGGSPASERLRGRWTLLFTPGEPCVDTCARVLETLSAVAHDPASGIEDGVAQVVLARPQGKEPAREIVVLDPDGHSAGLISHVTDAGRIVSGLATIRASYATGTTTASR